MTNWDAARITCDLRESTRRSGRAVVPDTKIDGHARALHVQLQGSALNMSIVSALTPHDHAADVFFLHAFNIGSNTTRQTTNI